MDEIIHPYSNYIYKKKQRNEGINKDLRKCFQQRLTLQDNETKRNTDIQKQLVNTCCSRVYIILDC